MNDIPRICEICQRFASPPASSSLANNHRYSPIDGHLFPKEPILVSVRRGKHICQACLDDIALIVGMEIRTLKHEAKDAGRR